MNRLRYSPIRCEWPRDARGKFLPHTGYPLGLSAWMRHNARR